MKKRFAPLVLVFVLILSLSANAAAPRAEAGILPSLTFTGTTANCSVTITAPGKDIEATITLWYGNRVIDSWSGSGSSLIAISGSAGVIMGEEYVLRVTGSIDDVPFDVVRVSGTC